MNSSHLIGYSLIYTIIQNTPKETGSATTRGELLESETQSTVAPRPKKRRNRAELPAEQNPFLCSTITLDGSQTGLAGLARKAQLIGSQGTILALRIFLVNLRCDSNGDARLAQHTCMFEKDVVALRNFSFISINADGTTFEMHGLVQLATRTWLEAHGMLERWKQQFVKNLCAEFPTGEYENWATCRRLFPHPQSAAAQRPQAQESLREWSSILYNAAWYAWEMGNGMEAEKMSGVRLRPAAETS
ncbi:hypothetical protein LTR06_011234 [Exophiala xenobiotica]|nr:hypothetical protein LTR06_011234 [Exophiala xenobiotica]